MTRSFGRLKVQRIRDISRRMEKKKQENKGFNNVEQNNDSTQLEISVSSLFVICFIGCTRGSILILKVNEL